MELSYLFVLMKKRGPLYIYGEHRQNLYINLEKRKDRKHEILSEFTRMGIASERYIVFQRFLQVQAV